MENNSSLDAWSQARAKFCEGLTPEEAVLFSSANLENVVEEAKKPILKHQPDKIAHGIESVVAAISQYGDALDVLSNTAPLIMSPLWGGLRVLLHLASEYGIYFEKLLKMFTSIGDVLPRFRTYEKLFPNNDRLRENLSNAYLDILRFCTSAKFVFKRKHPSAVYLNVLFRSSWRPFQKEFGNILDAFRQHQKTIEREAGLSHMLEADKDRKLEQDARHYLQKRHKGEERSRLLGLLSDVPWKAFHHRQQRLRHEGTGKWLQDRVEFKTWMSEEKSSCISCCGIPGAGKTILCSSIIGFIQSLDTRPAVAYHYFDYRDQKTMTTTGVLGSIMQQILLSTTIFPEPVEKILSDIYLHDFTTPLPDDLTKALCLALETSGDPKLPTYIFVDGLDECNQEVQNDILLAINTMMDLPTKIVKVFMSFRDDERIMKTLGCFPCIKLLEAQLSGDIVAYVEDTVKNFILNGFLVIEIPELEKEIVDELVSKACGMFLWVYLQLEEICDNTHSDASIRETLRNLPIGLEATYKRIMDRIGLQTARQRKIAQRILEWVVCAKRPLTTSELKEAIFLEPTQKSWDDTQIPGDKSHKSLIQTCHNLVILDDYDGTIRLAHHTVEKFLVSSSNVELGEGSPFLAKAREGIKDMCIAYLMFSDFEVQVAQPIPEVSLAPLEIFASASIRQTTSALGISASLSLPCQLWKGHTKYPSRPELDYGKFVETRIGQRIDPSLSDKYCLLDYIINNWLAHVSDLATESSEVDAGYWKSLRYLALEKQAPFSFRPWDWTDLFPEDPSKPDLPDIKLFDWAVENGHFALLRLISANEQGSLRRYIAYANTREGHKDRIERLVTHKFDAGFSTMMEAFVSAAAKGDIEVLDLIFGVLPVDIDLDPKCLVRASQNGQLKIVERLLNAVSFEFGTTEDAASSAASGLHATIFHLLLKDRNELPKPRSLRYACTHGFEEIVKQLLELNSYCLEELIEGLSIASDSNIPEIFFATGILESSLLSHPPTASKSIGSDVAIMKAISLAYEYRPRLVHLLLKTNLFRPTMFPETLAKASSNGDVDIVKMLLEGDFIFESSHIMKAMYGAIDISNTEIFNILLGTQTLTIPCFFYARLPVILVKASAKGCIEIVRSMLEGDFPFTHSQKLEAMHVAAKKGNMQTLNIFFTAQGKFVDVFTPEEIWKVVSIAEAEGHTKIANLLLESDPLSDHRSQMLIRASKHGSLELVGRMLEEDTRKADQQHKTLLEVEGLFTTYVKLDSLWFAVAAKYYDIAKLILGTNRIPAALVTPSAPRRLKCAFDDGHLRAVLKIGDRYDAYSVQEAYQWAVSKGYKEIAESILPLERSFLDL